MQAKSDDLPKHAMISIVGSVRPFYHDKVTDVSGGGLFDRLSSYRM